MEDLKWTLAEIADHLSRITKLLERMAPDTKLQHPAAKTPCESGNCPAPTSGADSAAR